MHFQRPLLFAAALLALSTAAPAMAQADATTSIKTTDTISAEQYAQIDAWVTRQMNQIRSGLPEDVSAARETLIKELRTPGASAAYKTALSKSVLASGAKLLDSQKLLVQVNMVTILAQVNTLDAVQALAPMVNSPAAGLRYKACQSIRLLIEPTPAERRSIGADREQILTKALAAQIAKETDRNAYREMVELLGTVATPAAQDALIRTLDARLSEHVSDAALTYETELLGINILYRKFIQSEEKGALMNNLLALAYRHEKLATAQIAGNLNTKDLQTKDRKDLIQACDKMIRAQYVRLGPGTGQLPPDLAPLTTFNKWKETLDALLKWEPLLKAAPFALPAEKLK